MSNAARRAGAAARGGILAVLAIGAVILGILLVRARQGDPARGRPLGAGGAESAGHEPPASAPNESALTPALRAATAPEIPSDELTPFASAPEATRRTGGSRVGSLRGRVDTTGAVPFPREWVLVAQPSLFLEARESAVERRLEFDDGRREFQLEDLPFGGYDVAARAEGFNGLAQPILIEAGSEHPYVMLRLTPTGFLEGTVLDADGLPAEDVLVSLLGASDPTYERVTSTDGAGLYRFEGVPDGPYEILLGVRHAPLSEKRRPLTFRAPSLTFPPLELPPLGALSVSVIDSRGRPLEGVEVTGSGSRGGLVEGISDHQGRLTVRHLPPGRYRLRLVHPGFGEAYERRMALELSAGKLEEAQVRLGP